MLSPRLRQEAREKGIDATEVRRETTFARLWTGSHLLYTSTEPTAIYFVRNYQRFDRTLNPSSLKFDTLRRYLSTYGLGLERDRFLSGVRYIVTDQFHNIYIKAQRLIDVIYSLNAKKHFIYWKGLSRQDRQLLPPSQPILNLRSNNELSEEFFERDNNGES